MATTYLTRTPSSSGSNTTWTFSAWIKRSALGLDTVPFATGYSSPQIDESIINIGADDQLRFNINVNDVTDVTVQSSRKLRDTSGWYHIVVACDTTQATASDRIKIYFNGELETNLSNTDYPTQNQSTFFGDTNKTQEIGRQPRTSNYFDGLMSYVHFTDGTAYQASDFGQYDANGVWTINTSPSVTYGTNGFFILKDGNSVTDQSGQGNNFTVGGGTLTNTEDSPSNVFATWNPLGMNRDVTFSSGNTHATYGTSGTRDIVTGTLGAVSGKYYWEIEIQGSSSANNAVLGVSLSDWNSGYAVAGETNYAWGFRGYDGAVYNNNSSVGGTWSTFTNGDKIGVAVNLDDEQGGLNKLYFSKNGTWLNGADPSNLTSTTGVVGITKPENGVSGFLFPVISDAGSTATPQFITNFGNGYFGTTAVSSAGTNASGIGIFEYDVPTGFTALSTKGLNL